MPKLFIRDLDEMTRAQLEEQARRNGRSLPDEVRAILTNLADEETATQIKEALRGRVFSDSAAQLREERALIAR
jgi:plasmid stability protein